MKHKQLLFPLLAITLLFANCKKSKTNPIPVDNTSKNRQFLIGKWKLSAVSIDRPFDWDGDGTKETDIYPILDACGREQYYNYQANDTLILNFDCRSTNILRWNLENFGTRIRRINQYNNVSYEDIINITNTDLTIFYKRAAAFPERTPYTITAKFKKQ